MENFSLKLKNICTLLISSFLLTACGDLNSVESFSSNQSSCTDIGTEVALDSNQILVGDMVLPASAVYLEDDLSKYWPQKRLLNEEENLNSSIISFGVAVNATRFWTDGILPIEFSDEVSSELKGKIEAACLRLSSIADITCVERTDEEFYVNATTSSSGCFASVGRTRVGRLNLNLGSRCDSETVILHELMHNLGIMHEHQHPSRDSSIRVITENIEDGAEGNFVLLNENNSTNTDFDFDSVMMYFSTAFSINRSSPAIVRRSPACDAIDTTGFPRECLISFNNGLSSGDEEHLLLLYGAPDGEPVVPPVTPPPPEDPSPAEEPEQTACPTP